MMMNIRGLILDDPEHTVHLQALTFIARKNADSETEGTLSICTEITASEPVLLGSGDIENGV
jgi:hypothetical protein